MPLHRRLPKRGFTSLSRRYVEVVRLHELQKLGADEIDLMVLKQAGVVSSLAIDARVIASGELSRKVSVRGIGVTREPERRSRRPAALLPPLASKRRPARSRLACRAPQGAGGRDCRGRQDTGRGEAGGQAGN